MSCRSALPAGHPVFAKYRGGEGVNRQIGEHTQHGGVEVKHEVDVEALRAACPLLRLGEPYLTTRARAAGSPEPGGLGLGIFIAKTLLERTGARLRFENEGDDPDDADDEG